MLAADREDVYHHYVDPFGRPERSEGRGRLRSMSLLAMDTSSLFDPFEFPADMDMDPPKPQPNYREKLEIKTKRHHDHYLKVCRSIRLDWEIRGGLGLVLVVWIRVLVVWMGF